MRSGCGGVVGGDVVEPAELVGGGAEVVERAAGVVAAHLEVDEDDAAAVADDLDAERVGGDRFR
jgi:hypothetical protein